MRDGDQQETTLPADIGAALLEAVASLVPDAPTGRALRARVLQRVRAQRPAGLLTIRGDEGAWRPFLPKISIKVLHEDAGCLSYLLRLEPGAEIAPHAHPLDEECVVLEGEVHLDELVVCAGDYHLAPGGVPHRLLRAPHGALLFLRGAVPDASHFL